jgi:DnaJ-class molecular chaperone
MTMVRMPKGTGDFDPPEDEDPPECSDCNGMGRVWDVTAYGYLDCDTCGGTGYQPEPEYEPGIEVEE